MWRGFKTIALFTALGHFALILKYLFMCAKWNLNVANMSVTFQHVYGV